MTTEAKTENRITIPGCLEFSHLLYHHEEQISEDLWTVLGPEEDQSVPSAHRCWRIYGKLTTEDIEMPILDVPLKSQAVGIIAALESLYGENKESDGERQILIEFIKWQKKRIDYQATYQAFLLGAMTEEEFKEESSKYTITLRDVTDFEALNNELMKMSVALRDFDFTLADAADFLQVSLADLHTAISSSPNEVSYVHQLSEKHAIE